MLLKTWIVWKVGKWCLWLSLTGVAVLLVCNLWVVWSVQHYVHTSVQDIETRDVGLVLGTSPKVRGVPNAFYTTRIKAAAELFHAGKLKHLIVSGDNSKPDYNEPKAMRQSLMELGVPDSCITMDFAGFRTLDSVVRCKKIFQQQRFTVISQEFHNYRALFIAQRFGLDAIAYNAPHPSYATPRTTIREYFARAAAVVDLYILNTQPKFLGEKIDINV